MSVLINCITAVILKSALERSLQNGCDEFRSIYPDVAEDDDLFALPSMSGGELLKLLNKLNLSPSDYAIGDMFTGELSRHPDVEFVSEDIGLDLPGWKANFKKHEEKTKYDK